jgi:hypothetical protein
LLGFTNAAKAAFTNAIKDGSAAVNFAAEYNGYSTKTQQNTTRLSKWLKITNSGDDESLSIIQRTQANKDLVCTKTTIKCRISHS